MKSKEKAHVGIVLTALAIPLLAFAGFAIYWYIDYIPVGRLKVTYPRVDCYPEGGRNESLCRKRGCVWAPTIFEGNAPWCIFPEKNYGYQLAKAVEPTDFGLKFHLQRINTPSLFSVDVDKITLDVEFQTVERVRLKFYDPNNPRYEVPNDAVHISSSGIQPIRRKYLIDWKNDSDGFSIQIIRQTTGSVLIDTSISGFIFSDQFLQIGLKLSSSTIYGLGENAYGNFKHDINWKEWSIFSSKPAVENEFYNSYGHHPFFLNIEEDGSGLGVLLLNSNAMEIELMPTPAIIYRTTGGIFDFYIFIGPQIENVIDEYIQTIGRPFMPPYWSLGFHLMLSGYSNIQLLHNATINNWATGIPYDVLHIGGNYMKDRKSFTHDRANFKNLSCLIEEIHKRGQHFMLHLDAGISSESINDKTYFPLHWGLKDNIFIKNSSEHNIEGKTQSGYVYFPDFTSPKIFNYWYHILDIIYRMKKFKFDGLLIDMNTPSNLIDGSRYGCKNNNYNNPKFIPTLPGYKLYSSTICMDSKQTWGLHYNVHSLYGHSMVITTWKVLQKLRPNFRPLILTQSSFVGTGHYAGHWAENNICSWKQLRRSIPFMLEMNLYGMPFVGADICIFNNNDEELSIRWMQLGAFYPLSRNNAAGSEIQDPTLLGDKFLNITKNVLATRYSLLPYLYTLFYSLQKLRYGGTVIRSLAHEFPTDKNTWDIDKQFLWGSSLLISPALYKGQNVVRAFFPKTRWYDFYTGKEQQLKGYTDLPTSLESINVHIRGGYIIPIQKPAQTTTLSRKNPMELIIALDGEGTAIGSLYWDDGDTYQSYEKKKFFLVTFFMKDGGTFSEIKRNELISYTTNPSEITTDLYFSNIHIYGVNYSPDDITLHSISISLQQISYDKVSKVLHISGLHNPLLTNLNLSLIYKNRPRI